MSSFLSTWLGLKEGKQEEPQTQAPIDKSYHPFPELSGKEKMEAVEKRLIQKFRESLIEGQDVKTGELKDDLDWLYHVLNYGKDQELGFTQRQRIAAYYILHKDPELWETVEKIAERKLKEKKFDYQAKYIRVCGCKTELALLGNYLLQGFSEFSYFTVIEGAGESSRIRHIAEDYKTYEELEIRLLEEGYKFIREEGRSDQISSVCRVYWKG